MESASTSTGTVAATYVRATHQSLLRAITIDIEWILQRGFRSAEKVVIAEIQNVLFSQGPLDASLQDGLGFLFLLGHFFVASFRRGVLVQEKQRRQTVDRQSCRHLFAFVRVELYEADLSLQFLGGLLVLGAHEQARAAPRSVGINDQRSLPFLKHHFELFSGHLWCRLDFFPIGHKECRPSCESGCCHEGIRGRDPQTSNCHQKTDC
mmetsp:Transcript_12851/g.27089  ORF Transcript_12851/g.27089 Transcript_12851/m.27089 type:complete len:208 (-) Transcript_12851:153-776(-)